MAKRQYRLTRGVQEPLKLLLAETLAQHIKEWSEQVEAGVIEEEARLVFSALGWITMRDTRVEPIARGKEPVKIESIPDPGKSESGKK